MQVKVKKLNEKAVIPKQTPGNAGADLTAVSMSEVINDDGVSYYQFDTGLSFEIPPGYVGLIFPRSSITNTSLLLGNHVGVIDSSFRGSVSFRFKKLPENGNKIYQVGERIGQMIIVPYPEINFIESEELSSTERNQGSYGSTGK